MCHYIYTLFVCCDEPKEYDGVNVLDVTYCQHCPVSADSRLYDDDFFHCPSVTSECLGDSVYRCHECSRDALMQDGNDDRNGDNDPVDDFSEYSDAGSDGGMVSGGMCRRRPRGSGGSVFLGAVAGTFFLVHGCGLITTVPSSLSGAAS